MEIIGAVCCFSRCEHLNHQNLSYFTQPMRSNSTHARHRKCRQDTKMRVTRHAAVTCRRRRIQQATIDESSSHVLIHTHRRGPRANVSATSVTLESESLKPSILGGLFPSGASRHPKNEMNQIKLSRGTWIWTVCCCKSLTIVIVVCPSTRSAPIAIAITAEVSFSINQRQHFEILTRLRITVDVKTWPTGQQDFDSRAGCLSLLAKHANVARLFKCQGCVS